MWLFWIVLIIGVVCVLIRAFAYWFTELVLVGTARFPWLLLVGDRYWLVPWLIVLVVLWGIGL